MRGYFGHLAPNLKDSYDRAMSEFTKALLIANSSRCLFILAGMACVYMGYRLFVRNYVERGGEVRVNFGDWHILVKQVAPGVFFALVGLAVIAVGVFRPIEINVLGSGWGKMSYSAHKPLK